MAPLWMMVVTLVAAEPALLDAGQSLGPEVAQCAAATNRKPGARQTAGQLREAVHAALRQEATSRGTARDAALVELTALFRELTATNRLPEAERVQLRALVRHRLVRRARSLERELSKADSARAAGSDKSARIARLPGKERTILGQQAPVANQPRPQGAARVAVTNSPAQELIDLITGTIAPDTWDINGGLGTIRYFSLGHVLVVRQTAEVHGQLGDVVGQLRGN